MISERLLSRYVAGACTSDEVRAVERWLEEDPGRRAYVDELRAAWEQAEEIPAEWNTDAAWIRLSEAMRRETALVSEDRPARPPRRPPPARLRRGAMRRKVYAYAALLVVSAVAVTVLYRTLDLAPPGEEIVQRTQTGERKQLRLADGTEVWLNAGSDLHHPRDFVGDERVVRLEGEAYFDVAPDAGRPFVLYAGGAVTRVLGTAFGVRAYPEEERVQVVVEEGRVLFEPLQAQDGHAGALLERGHRATLGVDGVVAVAPVADAGPYVAWKDGRLVFEETPFGEALPRLERWYGFEGRIADESLAARPLSAAFAEESFEEVLDVLALALRLRYERDGQAVTFFDASNVNRSGGGVEP